MRAEYDRSYVSLRWDIVDLDPFRLARQERDMARPKTAEEEEMKMKREAEAQAEMLRMKRAMEAERKRRADLARLLEQQERERRCAADKKAEKAEAAKKILLMEIQALVYESSSKYRTWDSKRCIIQAMETEILHIQEIDIALSRKNGGSNWGPYELADPPSSYAERHANFMSKCVNIRTEEEYQYHERRTAVRVKETRLARLMSECRDLIEKVTLSNYHITSKRLAAGGGVEVLKEAKKYRAEEKKMEDFMPNLEIVERSRRDLEQNIISAYESRREEERKWILSQEKAEANAAEEKMREFGGQMEEGR